MKKRCSKCKTEFSLDKFYKQKNSPDGLEYLCKYCSGQQTRDYQNLNHIVCIYTSINKTFSWCKDCKIFHNIKEFGKSNTRKNGLNPSCKVSCRQRAKLLTKKHRKEVLDHYGNKCNCCGETEQDFLTIDHINNNGAKHRIEIKNSGGRQFYAWIIRNNFPKDLQILCWNCNCGKQYYGLGIQCPHKFLKEVI